jgi:hypothetical protein
MARCPDANPSSSGCSEAVRVRASNCCEPRIGRFGLVSFEAD